MSEGMRSLDRPDGARIGWRVVGRGARVLVMFHATLSSGAQLVPLAERVASEAGLRVLLVDRRGVGLSGAGMTGLSPDGPPRAPVRVAIGTHVDDVLAILDAERLERVGLFGHSYGANVAIELAARHPERIAVLVGWEPPYTALSVEPYRSWLRGLRDEAVAALETVGPAAAAESILRRISGDAAWERLSPRARRLLAGDGEAATSDVEQRGLDPAGLDRIVAPTTFLVSDASGDFYPLVAEALRARIATARITRLAGLAHMAPVTDPAAVAPALAAALAAALAPAIAPIVAERTGP